MYTVFFCLWSYKSTVPSKTWKNLEYKLLNVPFPFIKIHWMIQNILGWKYNWKFALFQNLAEARAFWKLGRILGWCVKRTHTTKNDSNLLDTTTHPTDQEKKTNAWKERNFYLNLNDLTNLTGKKYEAFKLNRNTTAEEKLTDGVCTNSE